MPPVLSSISAEYVGIGFNIEIAYFYVVLRRGRGKMKKNAPSNRSVCGNINDMLKVAFVYRHLDIVLRSGDVLLDDIDASILCFLL